MYGCSVVMALLSLPCALHGAHVFLSDTAGGSARTPARPRLNVGDMYDGAPCESWFDASPVMLPMRIRPVIRDAALLSSVCRQLSSEIHGLPCTEPIAPGKNSGMGRRE